MVADGFLGAGTRALLRVETDPGAALDALV
jgi:hypothetical protein